MKELRFTWPYRHRLLPWKVGSYHQMRLGNADHRPISKLSGVAHGGSGLALCGRLWLRWLRHPSAVRRPSLPAFLSSIELSPPLRGEFTLLPLVKLSLACSSRVPARSGVLWFSGSRSLPATRVAAPQLAHLSILKRPVLASWPSCPSFRSSRDDPTRLSLGLAL